MARTATGLILILFAGLGACEREARPLQSPPEARPDAVRTSDLTPGGPQPTPSDPRARQYEANAYHIGQGQKYFRWFNCNGCHANGGGGMGPALMDAKWRYGGGIEQIHASILGGRPNGMPAFEGKIPDQQAWEIAAYVRALSGNADKLAAPSRADAARSIPPINNIDHQPPKGSDQVPGGGA